MTLGTTLGIPPHHRTFTERRPCPGFTTMLVLLSVSLLVTGCGGGGADAGGEVFTSLVLAPTSVPESLETTVRLSGFEAAGARNLTLFVGGERMNVRGDDDPRVQIDAFEFAAGEYPISLESDGTVLGTAVLRIDAQPVINDVTPDPITAEGMEPMVLSGSGFRNPILVELEDEHGTVLGEGMPATASADGTEVVCQPPFPMAGGPDADLFVQVRGPDRQRARARHRLRMIRSYRQIDGSSNSPADAVRGSAGIALLRNAPADYADGISALAGPDRTNPRTVSNKICAQTVDEPNSLGATDYLWQWGQFLDHDIDLSTEDEHEETANIAVPLGDLHFDPFNTGIVVIPMTRSAYVEGSTPRQQINAITAFIDASNVYGSNEVRARALRILDGSGQLKTSAGQLLPFNEDGLPNAGGPGATLFVAGDIRANEQLGLTCMHTLFMREHNRLATALRAADSSLSGDEIYHEARRIVGAQMQVITYEEFLPLLLGRSLDRYRGYDAAVDPGIANEFSTAGYRLGHSLLSTTLLRVDASGDEIGDGHLSLSDAFFRPDRLVTEGGIDPVLRGLAAQVCQELDSKLVGDVRNFLFGPPGAGGLDLAALNVQRGRDHGLATYNDARVAYGLSRAQSFADVSSKASVQAELADAYETVDDIDLWIGGMCEDHVTDGLLGAVFSAILRDQFERLRAGDRYWYERTFSGRELNEIRQTRLGDIIRRNTNIGSELPRNVFRTALPSATAVVADGQ